MINILIIIIIIIDVSDMARCLLIEWDIWTQFAAQYSRAAFKLDGLANSHPIEVEVGNPGEIGEIFDLISYQKGASVIRMLAEYLGQDTFKHSLQVYLNRHLYRNAVTRVSIFVKCSGGESCVAVCSAMLCCSVVQCVVSWWCVMCRVS